MQGQGTKPHPKKALRGASGSATSAAHTVKAGGAGAAKRGQELQKSTRPGSSTDKDGALTPANLLYISEEHTNQLRQAFDMFDSAGTGRIKVNEVKVAFYALGYAVNSLELDHVLREAGVSSAPGPNGEEPTMDFNDFYNVLLRKMTEKENRIESVRAFTQIDQDNKGYISLEDLHGIASSLRMELTDDELIEMILFAQATSGGAGGGGGHGGLTGMAAEFGAKESLAVTEEQFLKLLKRANVF